MSGEHPTNRVATLRYGINCAKQLILPWLGRSCLPALCALLGVLLWPIRSSAGPSASATAPSVRVGLRFLVAQHDGAPVAGEDFLHEQLTQAQQIFAPLGVELVRLPDQVLPAQHAELLTRADRDALAAYVETGVIHCMVVAKLMDVDEAGRERRGVHWTPHAQPARHFVIVSAIAFPQVLAHELGHFFGNPRHSETSGNLMSYQRLDAPPFLDAQQQRRVRAALARMLRNGKLSAR